VFLRRECSKVEERNLREAHEVAWRELPGSFEGETSRIFILAYFPSYRTNAATFARAYALADVRCAG